MVILLLYAFLVWCWCWLFACLHKSLKLSGRLLLRSLRTRWKFCICTILFNGSIFSSLYRGSVEANWLLNVIIIIAFLCNLTTSLLFDFLIDLIFESHMKDVKQWVHSIWWSIDSAKYCISVLQEGPLLYWSFSSERLYVLTMSGVHLI